MNPYTGFEGLLEVGAERLVCSLLGSQPLSAFLFLFRPWSSHRLYYYLRDFTTCFRLLEAIFRADGSQSLIRDRPEKLGEGHPENLRVHL